MRKSRSYKELLEERLRDPQEAAAYLNAALEDDDPGVFLIALRDVALANGGIMHLAKEAQLNRETLYRTLSKKGNPTLISLRSLLRTIGLEIVIHSYIPHNDELFIAEEKQHYFTQTEVRRKIAEYKKEMKLAAKEMRFEDAAKARDLMFYYQQRL